MRLEKTETEIYATHEAQLCIILTGKSDGCKEAGFEASTRCPHCQKSIPKLGNVIAALGTITQETLGTFAKGTKSR